MLPDRPAAPATPGAPEAALTISQPGLEAMPGLRHGFSTRACGNLATRYGPPAAVAAARRRFAEAAGIDPQRAAHFALTNSSRVGLVGEPDALPIDETPYRISLRGLLADATPDDLRFTNAQGLSNQAGIDALVTAAPGVALFMVVGDAAPLMLVAPERRCIALAHVGLVGTVNRIVAHAVAALCQVAGCQPAELVAGIGPTVGPCCYSLAQSLTWAQVVSEPFWAAHGPQGAGIVIRNDQYYFDLPAAISALLAGAGLDPANISAANLCTACPDSLFFPHRAGVAGRFGALLAVDPA